MSQIIYPITHLPPVIDIGKQTEKGVTRIGFDMHEWLDDWPGMTFSVQPTRPGETESYFAASEMVGSVVFWLVGAVDTEKPGSGTVEVLGVTEDERKLSFMCRTSIANTNTATVAEVPEPNQPWVDQVTLAAAGAHENAKKVEATLQKVQEDYGNSNLYIVTVKPNPDRYNLPYADRTQEEIRAAVAAGKTCVLVYSDGRVFTYYGEELHQTDKADCPMFVGPVDYDASTGLYYRRRVLVRQSGNAVLSGSPIRTPNPNKLKLTGAVEAEYDGSKQVTVEIPSGGAGLPETADPLKQLVTDENGNVAWEDRLAYKTTEKVVNLKATALTFNSNEEAYVLSTPWTANLVAGAMCTVTYNGTDYECKAVDFRSVKPEAPFEGCLLGNIDALGMTGVDGSNTAAPFALMVVSNAHAAEMGAYGVVYPLDGATSVTIAVSSAVESYKTIDPEYLPKSDSDTVTVVYNYSGDGSVSHTFDEVLALANAGKHLILRADTNDAKIFAAMTLCRVNGEESTVEFALVDTTGIMRFVYNKSSGMNVHIKTLD